MNLLVAIGLIVFFFSIQQTSFAAKDYLERIPPGQEDGYVLGNPVVTDYKIDLDGDGKSTLVKVKYGPGVSDKSLDIEVWSGKELVDTIEPLAGIQPNYKIEDVDKDGMKEIIVWGGLWDFRMPGEDGVTEETFEGHSSPHRYVVATYKLIKGNEFRKDHYIIWDVYTTKKKYDPFCEEQPAKE